MTLQDVKIEYQKELAMLYEPKEIQSIFRLVAEDLGYTPSLLIQSQFQEVSAEQQAFFEEALLRLRNAEPVQYVRGKADFYGLQFMVTESVLIPRPETEELVELIIRKHKNKPIKIVDLGTGSGCIAISLAKNLPNAEVCAIDISPEALNIARQNAQQNEVNVHFVEGSMCQEDCLSSCGTSDVIVSNPPYVTNSEKQQMRPNVLDFEPHLALFVEDANPLLFYAAIARLAAAKLTQNGCVYCEINEQFGKETVHLFESYGLRECEIVKDIFGKDRIVTAKK